MSKCMVKLVGKTTTATAFAAMLLAVGGCATQPADPIYTCELDGCYVYPGYANRGFYPYGYGPNYGPYFGSYYGPYSFWGGYGSSWSSRPIYIHGGSRPGAPPGAVAPPTAASDTRVVPFRPSPPPGASPDRRYPMGGASGGSSVSSGNAGGSSAAPSSNRRSGGGQVGGGAKR